MGLATTIIAIANANAIALGAAALTLQVTCGGGVADVTGEIAEHLLHRPWSPRLLDLVATGGAGGDRPGPVEQTMADALDHRLGGRGGCVVVALLPRSLIAIPVVSVSVLGLVGAAVVAAQQRRGST